MPSGKKTASLKVGKFNSVNFSYYFTVSFLSLLSVFVFFSASFFNIGVSTNSGFVASEPEVEEIAFETKAREPEVMLQLGGEDLPSGFFKPLLFGETIKGEINADDFLNPLDSSKKADGYWFTLPELENYDDVEVYFRSCPDDGDSDDYNNCLAFSSFTEELWIFDTDMKQLYAGGTRVDFDSVPVTANKTYYLLVGSNAKQGHYKITLDYEKQPVEFKVKFAGINSNRGDIKVNVKLYRPWTTQQIWDMGEVVLTADENGIYQGSFLIDNVSLDFTGNALFIKGPKHLQRQFSGLSFKKGEVLDLTYKLLEPGDLPLPQDGRADMNDFNYLWDHRGSSDAKVLETGDLNLDGVINMGDINLFLQTIQVKTDEEDF